MMNDELQMTNGTPAGKSDGSLRTLAFTSIDIRNSAFDIPTGPENAGTFRRDHSNPFPYLTCFLKAA